MYLGDNEMENKQLNNSVKYESLVQQLAEEFVKTLPEGVAKLFNRDFAGKSKFDWAKRDVTE